MFYQVCFRRMLSVKIDCLSSCVLRHLKCHLRILFFKTDVML